MLHAVQIVIAVAAFTGKFSCHGGYYDIARDVCAVYRYYTRTRIVTISAVKSKLCSADGNHYRRRESATCACRAKSRSIIRSSGRFAFAGSGKPVQRVRNAIRFGGG